jgi:ribosomal protein S18 acetylase RimI-like enzyme
LYQQFSVGILKDNSAMNIRPTQLEDILALKDVLDSMELFPSEMLPDMVSDFLGDDESHDVWLTCEMEGKAKGFCYAVTEKLTDGTWNMLALAVHPSMQGKGIGSAVVKHLETTLLERGQRVLIAETSGTQEFESTREFYRKNGFFEEARIRDFWAAGNDKIVFWKKLGVLIS